VRRGWVLRGGAGGEEREKKQCEEETHGCSVPAGGED
jgi:hypothetical protein